MREPLDQALRELLQRLVAEDPGRRVPFIVTLRTGARAAGLVPFRVEQEFEVIRAVSGTMTPAEALALSEHKDIERIEYDGQVHALAGHAGSKTS